MITYVIGLPRSGKSYYIVDYISKNYSKFDTVFTNINGFKFDKLPNTKKIHFNEFLDYAKELHKLYKEFKRDYEDYDAKLLEKLNEDGYKKCLFVIDECQEYLDRDLVHIKWLFSYHGHLGFEFIFATHALNLVNAKYKSTIEGVVKAVSNSFRLSSKYMVYNHYATVRMSKDEIYGTTRLLAKQEIFELYKSGDIVKKRSILIIPILILIFLFAAVYFYFKYFMSNNFKKYEPEKVNVTKNTNIPFSGPNQNIQSIQEYDHNYIYDVYCSKNKCSFNKFENIPLDLFLFKQQDLYKIRYEYQANYGKHYYIESNSSLGFYFKSFKVEDKKEQGFISGVINSPIQD
jgi:hypothetical protein